MSGEGTVGGQRFVLALPRKPRFRTLQSSRTWRGVGTTNVKYQQNVVVNNNGKSTVGGQRFVLALPRKRRVRTPHPAVHPSELTTLWVLNPPPPPPVRTHHSAEAASRQNHPVRIEPVGKEMAQVKARIWP